LSVTRNKASQANLWKNIAADRHFLRGFGLLQTLTAETE